VLRVLRPERGAGLRRVHVDRLQRRIPGRQPRSPGAQERGTLENGHGASQAAHDGGGSGPEAGK
ncbi:hypothetical protein P7K49_029927, partial [Saguinus oedipus]